MVTEQKIPVQQASKDLGIKDDTLRNWLKKAGIDPKIESKNNYLLKKVRELENQFKAKKAEVEQLKDANEILKKSILSTFQGVLTIIVSKWESLRLRIWNYSDFCHCQRPPKRLHFFRALLPAKLS